MWGARTRIIAALARLRLGRRHTGSTDALLSVLPDSALVPLQREGLDPVAELAERRAVEPVSRMKLPFGLRAWLVTGYEETKAVLANSPAFSNDFSNLVGTVGITADQNPGGLGFTDPPNHTRLRKLLTPEFTGHRLRRLTPRIEAIVEGQLDDMQAAAAAGERVDLVQTFALPIPSLTICELLGVPYSDRSEFQRLSTTRFDLLGGVTGSLGAISESMEYLLKIVQKQRDEPGDGLLGRLVREHGDDLSDHELAGLADGLLTGGLETTASMLALGTIVLMRHPESRDAIGESDEAVDAFVDELLRYLTVVQVAFPRFARHRLKIGGATIEKGDIVLCSLSAANRDGGMDEFDPGRPTRPHLAFGHGLHRCIGAELARMELRAAYPALVRRFPDIRLGTEPSELPFRKLSFVFGIDTLPVDLGVTAPRPTS
ncbi:cytochrome P450 [Pseudonocardia hierapolitana]|uniref:Cytochrome P450 n=1 Tax=Pseudonocardia hierapolitana TaxID=1128676 RepID=A0A561SQI1_9PSEU|nr:cytochrome P450 [Pseudonocardia hierapolitana]TWF77109.1 cytochrome P450 [Pseudonocardia hierapolitana]